MKGIIKVFVLIFLFIEREKLKYSYANILAEYEQWVQNVSDSQPMIACKEQQIFMSEYKFESNYGSDTEQTLGDGGDLEEVRTNIFAFFLFCGI